MQDVMVALYDDHPTAATVRTELVKEGFPTDRVALTSRHEHRQAQVGPAEVFETNIADYFRTLGADETAERKLSGFARAVVDGASAITVHPRGEEEIRRAEAVLERHAPREIFRHLPEDAGHVADRKMERAATPPQR